MMAHKIFIIDKSIDDVAFKCKIPTLQSRRLFIDVTYFIPDNY